MTINMNEKESYEIIKTTASLLSPFVASYLTYLFAIKGKKKSINLEKTKELNNVLAHLLNVFHYLTRLENFSRIKFDDSIALPFPKDYFTFILLKSGLLKDDNFDELEYAVEKLKEYDPISYFELEGQSRKLDFIQKGFILPFLKSKTNSEVNKTYTEKYLHRIISDVEDYIIQISKLIDKSTLKRSKAKLNRNVDNEIKEIINEILEESYEIHLMQNQGTLISYEQFINEMQKPEHQEMIQQQFELIEHIDIDKIIEIVADDPNMPLEQVATEALLRQMKSS